MIEVPIVNEQNNPIDVLRFEESVLGGLKDGKIRKALLKQAVVMYLANSRQGTVQTKNRSMVEGSTRKLYRQKGTGNARRGMRRTPIMKGGGHTFGKRTRDYRQAMNNKMRRLATRQAILAKFLDKEVIVVDSISSAIQKTAKAHEFLTRMQVIAKGALLAVSSPKTSELKQQNGQLYRSVRNIPKISMLPISDLNAHEVLRRKHIIFTKQGLQELLESRVMKRSDTEAQPVKTVAGTLS